MENLIQKAFENVFGSEYSNRKENEWATRPKDESNTWSHSIGSEFGVKKTRITVMGVGGAGNNMVTALSSMGIEGAETVAVNTDAVQLHNARADKKVLIGKEKMKGEGAGGFPEKGREAVEESKNEIKRILKDTDMLYILSGLGGGTGSGASPEIAKYAKEMGIITIACVTLPFRVEGARMRKAEDSLLLLRQNCDTVIVIENDKLVERGSNLPLRQAFNMINELIANMIKGVTETISKPSLVNLDYADVKAIMNSGGVATIGVGEAKSANRAEEAIVKAMNNPLLDIDYSGGTGALLHVTGGEDLKLEEIIKIGDFVQKHLSPEAQVIWGTRIDPAFNGKIRVIVIITGVKSTSILGPISNVGKVDIREELGIKVMA